MADLAPCGSATAPIQAPCTVPTRFAPDRVAALLGERTFAWWMIDDRLTLIARVGDEPWAMLCCAIQAALERVGETELAAVTVRVPRVREALIDAGYFTGQRIEGPDPIRGPDAPPPPPRAEPLRGRLVHQQLDSRALGEARTISIYLPPDVSPGSRLPVIYLADGDTRGFAPIAEAAVQSGRAKPAIIVGIQPGRGETAGCRSEPCDRRMLDYVVDHSSADPLGDTPFGRHMRFVTDEVIPYVERTYPASPERDDRIVAGYSNGASWALAAAALRSDLFGKVIAMSGGTDGVTRQAALLRDARIFAGAGLFEASFLQRMRAIAAAARGAGADVDLRVLVSGHSRIMWDILFAEGLAALLPAESGRRTATERN